MSISYDVCEGTLSDGGLGRSFAAFARPFVSAKFWKKLVLLSWHKARANKMRCLYARRPRNLPQRR